MKKNTKTFIKFLSISSVIFLTSCGNPKNTSKNDSEEEIANNSPYGETDTKINNNANNRKKLNTETDKEITKENQNLDSIDSIADLNAALAQFEKQLETLDKDFLEKYNESDIEQYNKYFQEREKLLDEMEKKLIEQHKKVMQLADEHIRSVTAKSTEFDISSQELIAKMEESRKKLDLEREHDKKAYEASVIAMNEKIAKMEAITASLPRLDQIFIPSARQFDVNDIQEDLEYLNEDLAKLEDRSDIPSNLQPKIESIFQNIKKQKNEILPLYLNLKDGINPKLYHEENRESDKNTAKNLLNKVDTFEKEILNLLKSFNQDPAKYGYKLEKKTPV